MKRKSIIEIHSQNEEETQERRQCQIISPTIQINDDQKEDQESTLPPLSKKETKIIKQKEHQKLDSMNSAEQKQRIQKSLKQKIYLISATREDEQEWSFVILGSQEIPYVVQLDAMMNCTCIDFQRNFKPCKHIYFILTQVAKDDVTKYPHDSLIIEQETMQTLDELLLNRLGNRFEDKTECAPPEHIDLKQDLECAICFIQMNNQSECLEKCPTCTKYFHKECITAWKKHKNTCPLCRSSLNSNMIREKGPFEKLDFVQLN